MMTVACVMDSDPRNKGEVFHLTLEHEPRGSPGDEGWSGGRFQANGIRRERAVRFLRALAERLEKGESIQEITTP